jgi:uncharacterized membrane protein
MIKNILLLAFIFILIDITFIYSTSNSYKKMINKIQDSSLKMKLMPTIICYILLLSSLYYFIIYKNSSYLDAFLLGFFIYGVYAMTNLAILKDWNYSVALIDTIWGGLLFLIVTYLYKNIVAYI